MYQRDFILRLIEQFARTLRALRDRILRREVDESELRATIAEVARQAGLDLDIARRLDPATLLLWLAPTGAIDEPRLWLMAELLYLAGLHGSESGAAGARLDFNRALAILARLPPDWRPSADGPTAGERSAELRRLLGP